MEIAMKNSGMQFSLAADSLHLKRAAPKPSIISVWIFKVAFFH
jgi:hypothetical protein